jgi:hypothetical protein
MKRMRKLTSKEYGAEESWFCNRFRAMADNAAAIMNQHCAVEIEELSSRVAYLPGTDNDEIAPDRDVSFQAGRVRTSGSGARLFVW